MARDMMLTMDEYLALRRLISSERESEGSELAERATNRSTRKPRKVSKYNRVLGRNIAMLESTKRKKDGTYKSGFTRSKIMSKAHKMTRKELNMR